MGDNLDDNDWLVEKGEGEDHADWVAEDEDEVDNDSFNDVSVDDDEDDEANKTAKKAKRKQKFEAMKEKKRQKLQLEESAPEEDPAHNQLSPEEMLATIDLHYPEDLKMKNDNEYSPENFFYPALDPNAVTESATKQFCPFTRALSAILPNYKKILLETPEEDQEKGSPTLLIVCSGAIRATEVIKTISSKLIKCKIAKLFAKHFKITEQIEFLSKEYYPIAIGTPNRLMKLMELGALHLNRTQVMLVDYTADLKNFNILTLPEVASDFYQFFYHDMVHKERSHLKVALVKDASPKATGIAPTQPPKKKEPTFAPSTGKPTPNNNQKNHNDKPFKQGGKKGDWKGKPRPGKNGKNGFDGKKKSFSPKKPSSN